jgi:hypothetical protein
MTDDFTQAEIVRALARIEKNQEDLGKKFDEMPKQFVPVAVFELRVAVLDREVQASKVALTAFKEEVESRRVPWTTVVLVLAGIVTATAGLVFGVISATT